MNSPRDRESADSRVPPEWNVGDVILGLYEVKGIHEGGGMGLVYRVFHRGWNMDLAVKSPRPEYFQTERQKEDFIRECETWINLGLHPHIVSCHYVRTLGGIPRVFAEYVEGGSLREWIDSRKLYEGGPQEALKRILDIAIQLAWGLQYAHEKGVIHQDVKPANVLMTAEGTAQLTDFGLAKACAGFGKSVHTGKQQSMLVSSGGMTPAYCSPEQANRMPLSFTSDVWSWAITVFEMFVGEPPCRYGGQLAGEVFASYLEDALNGDDLPQLPPQLGRLLTECFQEDPACRPRELRSVAERIAGIYGEALKEIYPRPEPRGLTLLADELNNSALSLRDLGDQAQSDRVMEAALRAHPGHLPLVFNHGILAWRCGQCTDLGLLTELRAIRTREPDNWSAAYAEGLAHLERWDIDSAVALLKESARLDGHRVVRSTLERAAALSPESARCLGPFEGKMGIVSDVVITPDEQCILSGADDRTLRLCSVANRRCIRTFEGHEGDVSSIALSADGKLAVSASRDRTLRLWDVQAGRCVRVVEVHTHDPMTVSLSPDGHYAASAGERTGSSDDFSVRLWDMSAGIEMSRLCGHSGTVVSVCFSSDGQWILSGAFDGTVRVWSALDGRCEQVLRGHTMHVSSVALSKDSRWAVSGSMDSTMRLWEVKTGRCLSVLPHSHYVYSVSISSDGEWALSACWTGGMCLWHLPTSRCVRTFEIENAKLTSIVSSALGAGHHYAISKHVDGTAHLWTLAALCRRHQKSQEIPLLVSRPRTVMEIARNQNRFSILMDNAQSALAAGCYGDTLSLLEDARTLQGFHLAKAALDVRLRVGLHCIRSGTRRAWCAQTFKGHDGLVGAVWLSADGRNVLSGSNDATVRVWDVATGQCVKTLVGHEWNVACVVGDRRDGRWAVSGSNDCTLRLWEVENGLCIRKFTGHSGYVYSACVSRDGRWMVSGSEDKTARLWDLSSGRCLRVLTGHTGGIRSVALSPDDQWLVTGSYDNRIIWDDEAKTRGHLPGAKEEMLRLWHLPTGKCVRILEGHASGVESVAFSEDGRRLLSASDDGTFRVWEVETGVCVHTVRAGTEGVLSADGQWVVSSGHQHSLRVWNLISGACEHVLEGHTDTVISSFLSVDSRWVLSGSMDQTARLWELDWDFVLREPADWDEAARFLLANFLTLQSPYADELPRDREPRDAEVALALTRRGKPSWTESDFERLLQTLSYAGYGCLRAEGVRRRLEQMAAKWEGPPPVPAA